MEKTAEISAKGAQRFTTDARKGDGQKWEEKREEKNKPKLVGCLHAFSFYIPKDGSLI